MLGFFQPMSQGFHSITQLCSQPWFWGDSSRFETSAFLRVSPVGTYIVRCANAASFRVEVKRPDSTIGHYTIHHAYQQQQYRMSELPEQSFATIEELIAAFSSYLGQELVPPARSPMTIVA